MSEKMLSANSLAGIKRHVAAKMAAIIAVLAIAAVMAVPLASRVSADDAPVQAVFGSVVEISLPDTLVVATDSGVIRLVVPGDSVFTGDITTIADISEGDRVIATAYLGDAGIFTAERLLIKPDFAKAVTKHILGVVLEVKNGSVAIQDRDGNTVTINVPSGMSVPKTGTVVTVIAKLDRATGVLTATGFETAENVVGRLEVAKDNAQDEEKRRELEEQLEEARNRLLTALQRSEAALEIARRAVADASPDERDEAERRLAEVRFRFNDLLRQYQAAAAARGEKAPELLASGTIQYEVRAWQESSGIFTLVPGSNGAAAAQPRAFAWTEATMAIVPVDAGAGAATPSEPVPLADVRDRVLAGSQVSVQYRPGTEPPLATVITVLPPRLPAELEAALEKERARNLTGFITLVEVTPDLDSATGVIVITDRATQARVIARVLSFTAIEVDGAAATIEDLAAGMAVEVMFDSINVTEDAAGTFTVQGRIDAARVRARTAVAEGEAYVSGVIVGIDPATSTVSIKPPAGDVLSLTAGEGSSIIKNAAQSSFSRLAVGDLVMDATRYDSETFGLLHLAVMSQRVQTFSGTISGLDKSPERLTITTAAGDVLSGFITAETLISSDATGPISFSSLAVGDRVLRGAIQPVQNGGTTFNVIRELLIGQPRITVTRGVVVSTDARLGRVTIQPDALSATSSLPPEVTLSISNSQRSQLFKNGEQIVWLETVRPRDIVEFASYYTASNEIVRLSVVSPNLQRVSGAVLTVAEGGLAITTPNGRIVSLSVSETTAITLNGRTVKSLESVQRGDVVSEALYISRSDNRDEGAALRMTIFNPRLLDVINGAVPGQGGGTNSGSNTRPVVEAAVSGIIRAIEGDVWTIGDRRFLVTGETIYFGAAPAIGLVAKATLRSRSNDGVLVATAVSVAGSPDASPSTRIIDIQPATPMDGNENAGLVRISGVVQQLITGGETVTGVVIQQVRLTFNQDTVISGTPAAGVMATAVVRRGAAGTVVATSISFLNTGNGGEPGAAEPGGNTPGGEDGVEDIAADGSINVKVEVHRVSWRLVLGTDGRLYLLPLLQARDLQPGDVVELRVRRVTADGLIAILSAFEIVELSRNPIYTAATAEGQAVELYLAE